MGRMAALSRDPCTGTDMSGAQSLSDCNTLSPDRSRPQRPLPRVADASRVHCAHSRPVPGHPQVWAHTAHSEQPSAPRHPASSGRRRPSRAELGAAAGGAPANPRNHASWFRSRAGDGRRKRATRRESEGAPSGPPSVGDPKESASQETNPGGRIRPESATERRRATRPVSAGKEEQNRRRIRAECGGPAGAVLCD